MVVLEQSGHQQVHWLDFNGTNNFIGNSAEWDGGEIYAETNSLLRFNGISTFSYNSAEWYGGAIHAETNSSLSFIGTTDFSNNSADYDGGAIDAYSSVLPTFVGTCSFSSNLAVQGGAITAYINTILFYDGSIRFVNNGYDPDDVNTIRDSHGGAINLVSGSTFSITHDTIVYWENNYANFGGVISVCNINFIYCTQIVNYSPPEKCCFFST